MEKKTIKEIKSLILKELYVNTSSKIMTGVLTGSIRFTPTKGNAFSKADLLYLEGVFPGSTTNGNSILISKRYIL